MPYIETKLTSVETHNLPCIRCQEREAMGLRRDFQCFLCLPTDEGDSGTEMAPRPYTSRKQPTR